MTRRSDDRIVIAPVGEWYEDLLTVDARITARSKAQQASSLLCAKLQEREDKIKERVDYLAKKKGVTFDEMWTALLRGDIDADDVVKD